MLGLHGGNVSIRSKHPKLLLQRRGATGRRSRVAMSGCSAWRSPQMSVNESMRFYHEKSTMSIAASLTDCSCPPCGEMGRSEAEAVANHNGFWLS